MELLFGSRSCSKGFKDWIFNEVRPSLRRSWNRTESEPVWSDDQILLRCVQLATTHFRYDAVLMGVVKARLRRYFATQLRNN